MLEFDVIPGKGLRCEFLEFQLGMGVCEAIKILQRHAIKAIDFLYSPGGHENPAAQDISLILTGDNIKLLFDGYWQRLRLIEVFDLSKVILKYGYSGNIFASPTDKPTVIDIDRCFGATHPGVYDPNCQLYTVSWRGLSFSFAVESKSQLHYGHGLSSLQFPDGSSPEASKMSIFDDQVITEAKIPLVSLNSYYGNVYLGGRMKVIRNGSRTVGLFIPISVETIGTGRCADVQLETIQLSIQFGDSCQKVLELLGSPNRIFYKSDDKMRIHLPQDSRNNLESDVFFNYFSIGLDILFSGDTNRVKKVVLHTNHPGHFDFGVYNRCHFYVPLTSCQRDLRTLDDEIDLAGGSVMWEMSRWDELQAILYEEGPTEIGKKKTPVVLNRVSSSGFGTNPFGSTFCYAHQDLIFEVMSNNLLASVTLCGEEVTDEF